MARTAMRIVGMNEKYRGNEPYAMCIQRYDRKAGEWTQEDLSENEFIDMMKTEFADFWSEYEKTETDKTAMNWFYDYGFDGGEKFVFK